MKKRLSRALAFLLSLLFLVIIPPVLRRDSPKSALPGTEEPPRQLIRIWVASAPGGGMAWLKSQLRSFEKSHPGAACYVRQVTPDLLIADASPLPDVVLFMPGEITAPERLLLPLTGALQGEESLLRAGRWQGLQYAAPLCWSGWVLAIDSQYDDIPAVTPAPTTLLGRPAPTSDAQPTATPGFPLVKAQAAQTPLLAPQSAGLFSLRSLTGGNALPLQTEPLASAAVYESFLARKAAAALLTTGQATALQSLQSAGRGFPCRILTPREIITDQVWMAGLCSDSPAAAALLAYLTGEQAQRQLAAQGLYAVSLAQPLYGDSFPAQMETAARRSLTAVNAFLPKEAVSQAAWQAYTGAMDVETALLPLL